MKPLHNITVVDLSKVLAGPLCGQYLGDLGANVIKVEPGHAGDDTRAWLPQKDGESATFLAVNHNKRSLAVDLKSKDGLRIVHQLIESADVVLQSFGGGTAERLRVDYKTVSALNSRLVYCEISGYGREGPLGASPGYDAMLQAFSGMLSTMGSPDGDFARASFSPVDLGTGMHAVSGVLAALLNRSMTGRGCYFEVSLLDTALGFMAYLAQGCWLTGASPGRLGTAHGSLAPYQAFFGSDGPVMIGVGNEAQWRRFCAVADLQELVDDPRFATNADRVANFKQTVACVQDAVGRHPVAHWLEVLGVANLPCAPIQALDQALTHPQVEARGIVVETNHPRVGRLHHIAYPVRFEKSSRDPARRPPLHGEHTTEILAELGYDRAAIDSLAARGVVRLGPTA